MKNIKKRLLSIIVLVAMVLCGMPVLSDEARLYAAKNEELSGEIEVVFNRGDDDMSPYVQAFEKKYPNVNVIYTCLPDYENEFKERVERGDYGDVVFVPSFFTDDDCKKYLEELGTKSDLAEKYNYIEQGRIIEDTAYGIPSLAYLTGMVYNKEVFDKAGITKIPDTIDEFLKAMEQIKDYTDAIPYFLSYNEDWAMQYWEAYPFIDMTGDETYKYGELAVTVNPFVEGNPHYEVMKLLYTLVEKGYTEIGVADIGWGMSMSMLNRGEIACASLGTWSFSQYKSAGDFSENIGYMPFPTNVDGVQYSTVTGDYAYGVAKNSENKEAAKAFVTFMLDESGYAYDHDTISILKTEKLPDCYGDMTHEQFKSSIAAYEETYGQYWTLTQKLNFYDVATYKRVVDAALGKTGESFEAVMQDWNNLWESSRADWMVTKEQFATLSKVNGDSTGDSEVTFSQNEIQYINENKLLKVGYHKNMAPLSYELDGEFAGVARDMFDMIRDKTGFKIEYYGYENSNEMEQALVKGEIDIIAGMAKNENNVSITYSKEYLTFMDVVIIHKNSKNNDTQNMAIAFGEQNVAVGDEAITKEYDTIKECIEQVQRLNADYAATNYYTANYYLEEGNYDDLMILPYTKGKTYHIGYSSDANNILVAICNKCIYSMENDMVEASVVKQMNKISSEFSLVTFVRANPRLSMMIVAAVVLVLIILFGIILYIKERDRRIQLLNSKKYAKLAMMADEYFFEYSYRDKQYTFDSKFVDTFKFDSLIKDDSIDKASENLKEFVEQVKYVVKNKKDERLTVEMRDEKGTKQWYRMVASVVSDKNEPTYMIGKMFNIQREMEAVETFQNKAYRDGLTKIYNREGLVANVPSEAKNMMLAIMDFDDFKLVNDSLGHDGGDYALIYFADKLEEHMGKEAVVARYGGDEFVAVLVGVSKDEARRRLELLINAMDTNLNFAGNTRKVSISVGAAYSEKNASFDELFKMADVALYKTKADGKNGLVMDESK